MVSIEVQNLQKAYTCSITTTNQQQIKKDVEYCWTHDQEKVFQALKTKLVSTPFLLPLD